MKLLPFVIERFAKWAVGGVPFESMKRIVSSHDENMPGMTGAQKRESVLRVFKTFGYELADFLVNLAIELAVAYFKSKAK